ncbi:MAG: disulfide bond formation protein B [Pseudomonadota bacterium]
MFQSPRVTFALTVVVCVGLLGYGYYLEYVEYLDPCNLCKLQRVAFMGVALFGLIGLVHGSGGTASRAYHTLAALSAMAGAALAWRQVWLQGLPPEDVPECSPGLEFMMQTTPWLQVFREVLTGSGSCAEIDWAFLGLSIAGWALVWFIALALFSLAFAVRGYRRRY